MEANECLCYFMSRFEQFINSEFVRDAAKLSLFDGIDIRVGFFDSHAELKFRDSLRSKIGRFYLFDMLSYFRINDSLQSYQQNDKYFNRNNFYFMYRGRLSQYEKTLDQTKISNTTKYSENKDDALQKQIQSYTRKFQQEKRKLFRAQQNHRQILKDFQNHVSDLQKLKTNKYQGQITSLNGKIKYLETNLEKSIAAYNEALSRNNMLKSEIDELRKDKKNQKQAGKTLLQKIEELETSINSMDQNISIKKNQVDKAKQQIYEVKQKNQKENNLHMSAVQEMKKKANFSCTNKEMKNTTKQTTQTSDTQPIVKLRIKNLMHCNKQKIKIVEMYKKSMEKIQQSFQQIKQESGIHDLEEITKTFLKQEEQNTLIYEYINRLTTQLELLRQQNQSIQDKILKQKENIQEHKTQLGGTPEQKKLKQKIENYYQEKQKHIDNLNQFLKAIEPDLLDTLKVQRKDNQNLLSYTNIEQYLAMFQVLINSKYSPNNNQEKNSQIKKQYTNYTKPLPSFNIDELKQRSQQTILQQPKFKDYASDFWQKKRQNK